ncbi:MAG TPA: TetR/AcrR family transcriptional regulator [Rhizomicrobium sp.]|jgi:AcrR family transcriptional regulator
MVAIAARLARTDRDERRETILKIAHAAFLEDGYAATSMSSIAARVGGSKATLYNYFSSKEELFAAVIAERCRDLQDILYDAELESPDIRKALTLLGERVVRWMLRDDSIATYRLITAEAGRFPELGRAFYLAGPHRGKEMLAEFFGRAAENGYLRPGDTMTMVIHFMELCRGDLHHRRLWNISEPSDKDVETTVASGVNVFLAAYGADSKS